MIVFGIFFNFKLSLLYCFRNDATEFGGSVFQNVNDDLQTGVQLSWTSGTNTTRFGIAGKYTLDKNSSISV